jgi:hypothetical protein
VATPINWLPDASTKVSEIRVRLSIIHAEMILLSFMVFPPWEVRNRSMDCGSSFVSAVSPYREMSERINLSQTPPFEISLAGPDDVAQGSDLLGQSRNF